MAVEKVELLEVETLFQGKVFLDPLQLRQVLVNLIQNAIAALDGEQNPKLSVTLAKDDQIMLLEVYDNGKGIPQEELGKIFIPFYTTVEDGTGIGLSVCRQIVWNHGGKISVDSNEGAHTKFTLEFPFS